MSNTASLKQPLGRLRSNDDGFFGRLASLLGNALDSCALIAVRNADQPYFGL